MAIVVQEVLGGRAGKWRVRLRHGDNDVIAEVATDSARVLLGRSVSVEIGIERIVACNKTHEASQIVTLPSGHNRLIGEIHDEMDVEDGSFLYDLYISAGPDYFAIDSTEIGGASLQKGERVAVDVEGLCFYPNHT